MQTIGGDVHRDLKRLFIENRRRIWLRRFGRFLQEWWFVIIVITGLIIFIFKLT
jgi:hypothetical protein